MKIRSLHPDFFTDAKVTGLSFGARILFEGLWCRSDDYGRGRMLEKAIEGDVFPRDDVDITALLHELIEGGLIRLYQSGQDQFYFIPTWEKYQSPKYRAKSSIPEPPDETPGQTDPGQLGTNSEPTPGQSSPDFSQGEGEGEGVTSPNGDGVFESLFEFVYGRAYEPGATLPKSERGRLNAGVREAKDVGITADEIRARGRRYATEWRGLTRSPQALLANWTRFAPEPEVPDCENCGTRGVIWFNPAGERVAWDAEDAIDAVKCRECAV